MESVTHSNPYNSQELWNQSFNDGSAVRVKLSADNVWAKETPLNPPNLSPYQKFRKASNNDYMNWIFKENEVTTVSFIRKCYLEHMKDLPDALCLQLFEAFASDRLLLKGIAPVVFLETAKSIISQERPQTVPSSSPWLEVVLQLVLLGPALLLTDNRSRAMIVGSAIVMPFVIKNLRETGHRRLEKIVQISHAIYHEVISYGFLFNSYSHLLGRHACVLSSHAMVGAAIISLRGLPVIAMILESRGYNRIAQRLNTCVNKTRKMIAILQLSTVGLFFGRALVEVAFAPYSFAQNWYTRRVLAAVCADRDPSHYTCRVDEVMQRVGEMSKTTPVPLGPCPPIVQLKLEDLNNVHALRAYYGSERDLTVQETVKFYHELMQSPGMNPPTAVSDPALLAAMVSGAQSKVLSYIYERGSYVSSLVRQWLDKISYGNWNGPTYAQTMLRYIALNPQEYLTAILNKTKAIRLVKEWSLKI